MKLYKSIEEVRCFLDDCRVVFIILNMMKDRLELSLILDSWKSTERPEYDIMNHDDIFIREVV